MYAIEFETSINSPFIELKNYQCFINKQAKVIVLIDDENDNELPQPAALDQSTTQQLMALYAKHQNDVQIDKQLDLNALANEINL